MCVCTEASIRHASTLYARGPIQFTWKPSRYCLSKASSPGTVNHVVQTIRKLLHKDHIEPSHVAERKGDIKHSLADITQAREALGYEPRFTFEQGIEKAIDWYRTHLGR